MRWDKLLEGKETSAGRPLDMLYGPQEDAKAKAEEARALAISGWFNVEDEVREAGTSGIDATGFAAALKKLKKGNKQSRRTDCRSPAEFPCSREHNSLEI